MLENLSSWCSWPTAARNICNKINKRFWKHLEYEKPMCFALMIFLWKPTSLRTSFDLAAECYSVLIHPNLNLWPVLSLLSCCVCLFATHFGRGYFSMACFIIHVPVPGRAPGAGMPTVQMIPRRCPSAT